ncbi:MAG: hypothetical protein KAS04_01545 [Candidatus Aenigmarchaeota archaeon]|nr:hypothetical protein [Candidatus Aenigmarchaeota archaeon]
MESRKGKVDYVRVYYTNGTNQAANVNENLTDSQIRSYFKIGERVNIGRGENDRMTSIKKIVIHRKR